MNEKPPDSASETDERFPSGPWTGYFLQADFPGHHWMDLDLRFTGGKIQGFGRDWVGAFQVAGDYETAGGKCRIDKHYLGRHHVHYKGFNEGRGIWGTWQIPATSRGGFHIWPKAMGDLSKPKLREEVDLPVGVVELLVADEPVVSAPSR